MFFNSQGKAEVTYDAIVVGSGISGGWAAKELCEKGLKTLVLERGRNVRHGEYPTAGNDPWDYEGGELVPPEEIEKHYEKQSRTGYTIRKSNKHWFVKDDEHPYSEIKRFDWMRGYHTGGRSIMWGRQSYRLSDLDFEANAKDGIATDWPIRYAEMAPCNAATLPAAEATGNMTLRPHSVVHSLIYDPSTGKASGVRVIDGETGEQHEFFAKIIFLCASALGSTFILMNTATDEYPDGLGSSSGQLGRNLMDHHFRTGASGTWEGFEDRYYKGRRPNGFYIPRFRNISPATKRDDYIRGFGYQGGGSRTNWMRGVAEMEMGLGAEFKDALVQPGPWQVGMTGFGECLPYEENRVFLNHDVKDIHGLPTLTFDAEWKDNEWAMRKDMADSAAEMLEAAGFKDVETYDAGSYPGLGIHEMGTARMGRDRSNSVLNKWNQEEFGGISALAEAMLPKTSTPGAGEVGVPAFVDVVLGKYTEAEDQQRIRTGLNSWLSGVATAAGKAYTELAAEEQNRLLNELDSSSKLAAEELAEQQLSPEEARSKAPWWLDMKSLMIGGYFSSEKVGTEVLAYDPVPGSYQGCIPLADVGSSWSL
eukprot:g600.t1